MLFAASSREAAPTMAASSAAAGSEGVEGVRWATGSVLLVEMLDQLKRFFWPWTWPMVSE